MKSSSLRDLNKKWLLKMSRYVSLGVILVDKDTFDSESPWEYRQDIEGCWIDTVPIWSHPQGWCLFSAPIQLIFCDSWFQFVF